MKGFSLRFKQFDLILHETGDLSKQSNNTVHMSPRDFEKLYEISQQNALSDAS